jgi:transposase
MEEIRLVQERYGLENGVEVESCYEAGWDGFWLQRYLEKHGGENLVVDSASIEINRRFRRVKTGRMDVGRLLGMLMRYHLAWGEKGVECGVSAECEDRR